MKACMRILLVAIAVIAAIGNISVALADDGSVVLPNAGPKIEGQTPGVNGYKVLGPDAVQTKVAQSDKAGGSMTLDIWWGAGTDIFTVEYPSYGVKGTHWSESDTMTDEIFVDGAIKRAGQGWYDADQDHSYNDVFAFCDTFMPTGGIKYTRIAHSWHHFHEDGYEDWDPQTEDSMSA